MQCHGACFVLSLHSDAIHKQLTTHALIDNAYTQSKPLISVNCSLVEWEPFGRVAWINTREKPRLGAKA